MANQRFSGQLVSKYIFYEIFIIRCLNNKPQKSEHESPIIIYFLFSLESAMN